MRVWSAILAVCCVVAVPALAQQGDDSGPQPQYVFKTTAAGGQTICYWAGATYSTGARIRVPEGDRDPHVSFQFFTCHAGTWAQD
jgi:hypothetical protein